MPPGIWRSVLSQSLVCSSMATDYVGLSGLVQRWVTIVWQKWIALRCDTHNSDILPRTVLVPKNGQI
jgi:hypothetical protein